jgi:hypothetical protein
MEFQAALKMMRAFSACNPRVYKQFAGFPETSTHESQSGYVLFIDSSIRDKPCYCELKDFARTHNLEVKAYGKNLMVSSSKNKF